IDSLDSYPVEGTPNGRTGVMVDNAVGLVMDHPTSLPGAVRKFNIFPIKRRHHRFEATNLQKFATIKSAKTSANAKRIKDVTSLRPKQIAVCHIVISEGFPKAHAEFAYLTAIAEGQLIKSQSFKSHHKNFLVCEM